jgi:hypothetical protein
MLITIRDVHGNISPGNDLSPLSLAVATWLGRRSFVTWLVRFDMGSNSSSDSPSDMPNDSLTEQLTCRANTPMEWPLDTLPVERDCHAPTNLQTSETKVDNVEKFVHFHGVRLYSDYCMYGRMEMYSTILPAYRCENGE